MEVGQAARKWQDSGCFRLRQPFDLCCQRWQVDALRTATYSLAHSYKSPHPVPSTVEAASVHSSLYRGILGRVQVANVATRHYSSYYMYMLTLE